ncbi:MAG: carboxypeptidase regulatory-like domain-containing protein [Vicinamibacterales bacterium]
MKRCFLRAALVVGALALAVASAYAQGGGASSTATITGRVTDNSGAILPGVTVTASSPSMLGTQTVVTSDQGLYRFPAVPPGTYTLAYELPGFNTLRREGIELRLGFTGTINVELQVASLQETVTVTGESPVIDTTATRVQQNFKLDELQSIPNARDFWSLLAITPAVQMSRIDVGGNRAGTQTGYTAYGFSGQVRVLIEGINTTEGTGGAGFYFDYASLEEVFIGTSGQSAEMPNPGVQSQFIAKSGGNRFSGEYYLDWYSNALQGSNIPDAVIARGIRPHSNEIQRYYDTAINVGGPIARDKVWWHFTYRDQKNAVSQPNFQFDKTFDTRLWNPVAKVTWQANQNNKFIGYYQWGQKHQPNRLLGCCGSYTYTDPGQTFDQNSGSWVYKAEWNGTLSDKLYVEARYGDFGYYFPLIANSDEQYFWRDTGQQVLTGAERKWELDRNRYQGTAAATYFLDTGRGSHTFKVGGEVLLETGWEGFLQGYGGNIEHQYANGRSDRIVVQFPTAREVGKLHNNQNLLSVNKLDQIGLFLNDTWSTGRLTLNLGVRYDRYKGWMPEQEQMGATIGPHTIASQTFPEQTFFTWNQVAPRTGLIYDLSGDGRTVIKANYGLYWHNPGVTIPGNGNPNQAAKTVTYGWNDLNGDRRFQLGEQTNILASALAGAVSIDPGIKAPRTHEASVWFERQLAETLGGRIGFVYKTEDDLITTYTPGRALNAYTVPFPFVDIGVDGTRGTSDDRTMTLFGMPTAQAANFPVNQVVMNRDDRLSRYKTVEASVSKRYGNRWSASLGGAHSWLRDFPETAATAHPKAPQDPGLENRSIWNFKATASYDAAYGIRISPVLRHQSGPNFARTIPVPASAAAAFGLTYASPASGIYAEPANANREDNIWVFDVRVEKTLDITGNVKLRGFLDLFNLSNSSAAETITRATGTNFLRPSAILAPRTARVGFRFLW